MTPEQHSILIRSAALLSVVSVEAGQAVEAVLAENDALRNTLREARKYVEPIAVWRPADPTILDKIDTLLGEQQQ